MISPCNENCIYSLRKIPIPTLCYRVFSLFAAQTFNRIPHQLLRIKCFEET